MTARANTIKLNIGTNWYIMRKCQECGRLRFYSLNFIFSDSICNECYMVSKERAEQQSTDDSIASSNI